jgi:uncharacterized protein involved in exopolysaccharide biosynthesis
MLEMIQSQDIRFKVFEAFKLAEHYKIAENDPHFLTNLNKRFESNVSFRKTENEAIQITVLDESPEIAANIVDSIIRYYNEMVLDLNKSKSAELVVIFQTHLNKKQEEIDSLSKILQKYRQSNNMLDHRVQIKEYTRAIANGKNLGETRETLENWRNLGNDYLKTDSLLWSSMLDFHEIKQNLEITVRDTSKYVTYAHVIAKPYVTDKKSYPTRWVFVFFSMLGALFTGILVLIFIDKARFSKQ